MDVSKLFWVDQLNGHDDRPGGFAAEWRCGGLAISAIRIVYRSYVPTTDGTSN
jgi:hypothetical protein